MKKEKAPAASSSMITGRFNNAKVKGHTRGLIDEHGDIKFNQYRGGVLHPSFRTTQGDI